MPGLFSQCHVLADADSYILVHWILPTKQNTVIKNDYMGFFISNIKNIKLDRDDIPGLLLHWGTRPHHTWILQKNGVQNYNLIFQK